MFKKKQDGSAIIVALFVVALVAAMSVIMMTQFQQNTYRTQLLKNSIQANLYARGSVAWALDTLTNNLKNKKEGLLIDKTPIESPIQKVEQATITSTIYDAQGLFNINNVTDNTSKMIFGRLIHSINPKITTEQIETITQATVDWVSHNPSSHFNEKYAQLDPPYQAPHKAMASMSELRLVDGMTAELFNQLSPFVIALPTTTPININNASAPILMALSSTLTKEAAEKIIKYRQQSPFVNISQFQQFDIVKNNSFTEKQITTESDYFLIKTTVKLGEQQIILYTLVKRDNNYQEPSTTILWQSKGCI